MSDRECMLHMGPKSWASWLELKNETDAVKVVRWSSELAELRKEELKVQEAAQQGETA